MDPEPNDSGDLQSFGYRQDLRRSLGSFSSFAAGFSYISILTGMFQMFYLGFGMGGPAFFWTWPMVLTGQFLVALCFAELAARYPLAGGVYQWSKHTANPFLGFLTGWIYLACLVVTLAAVALAMQSVVPQIWSGFKFLDNTAANAILIGCVLVFASTLINSFGVRLLASINNAGVISELAGVAILILLLAIHSMRPPQEAVFETLGIGGGGSGYAGPFLAAAALTASYVLYGFDTAGSLAEETHDPRRCAPRAILRALGAAGVAGLLVLLFALMSIPDLEAKTLSSADGGLSLAVKELLGGRLGRLLLCDVAFAIFVCTLAVHSGSVRVVFAMARDRALPFSRALASVSQSSQTPVIPAILTGAGATTILLVNLKFPRVVELVTAIAILWANLAYLLVIAALLGKRLGRWPEQGHLRQGRQAFALGKYGLAINVLALIWSLFMVVNVGWPRPEVYGRASRLSPITYTATVIIAGAAFFWFARLTRNRGSEQLRVRSLA